MKCPVCNTDLTPTKRSGVQMETCPSCDGMWLTSQELTELEDEVFDFGDDEKGSLMLGSDTTTLKCPQCAKPLRSFQYRLYDLNMDFCPDGHGYWLTADEDKRVLELMKKEEKDLGRTVLTQDRWAAHLRALQSGSLRDKLSDLLHKAIDPRSKSR